MKYNRRLSYVRSGTHWGSSLRAGIYVWFTSLLSSENKLQPLKTFHLPSSLESKQQFWEVICFHRKIKRLLDLYFVFFFLPKVLEQIKGALHE